MPSEEPKILELNQNEKSDKAPFIIYAVFECLIEKIDECKNSLENSCTTKVSEHIPSIFSMSTRSSFKSIENKLDVSKGRDCMRKFCESLRDFSMSLINFKKKKSEAINRRSIEIV